LLDFPSVLAIVLPSDRKNLFTPQLLLMEVVSLRALGQVELSDALIPHVRRQLLRWPWHERLLNVLVGRVPSQALLSAAKDAVQVCQLHYYAMVQKRFAG